MALDRIRLVRVDTPLEDLPLSPKNSFPPE
jgi:hypothetical protein